MRLGCGLTYYDDEQYSKEKPIQIQKESFGQQETSKLSENLSVRLSHILQVYLQRMNSLIGGIDHCLWRLNQIEDSWIF